MNIWHDVKQDRINKDNFMACVEISKGSKNKYELDKETGRLMLDRVLYTSTHYPQNYGFIPRTYAPDKDPLDVLVLCQEAIVPLALVKCYPIGVIRVVDNGEEDDKIIAIPFGDPTYNFYKDITQLPPHIMEELSHFYEVYKQLEGKKTVVHEILDCKAAEEVIQNAMNAYEKEFNK